MDERKKGLVKNTIILITGSFSSKILAFILIPMYTNYFLPSDFGEVDLYLTILSMLYIIFSLQSIESAFRFIQDCTNKKETISTITNAIVTALAGIFAFSIIMIIIGLITTFQYSYLFIAYVTTSIFANQFLHTIRGMNKTISYVTVGVISTVISASCNILFVAGIGMGAKALIITPIIANTIVISIIFYKEKFKQYLKVSAINIEVIKEQLNFSLPLIPNAISIWLLSAIGRFVLLFFYDTNAVGLLAFVLKFPMLLDAISRIFHMAWQVSAISQFNAKDKNIFASDVFNHFALLLLASLLLILPALKVLIFTIIGNAYIEVWTYIPFFLIGVVFKAFAQFCNVGFYGAKKTSPIFHSSLVASVVYFVVSMLLTKSLYILGISIAYLLSELVHWLYIVKKVSPYMKINIKVSKQIPILISIIIFITLYYLVSWKIQIVIFIVGIFLAIMFNRQLLNRLLMILKTYIKSR